MIVLFNSGVSKTFTAIGGPLTGHGGGIISVAFSPDGTHVASGSGDGTICLWDAVTGSRIGAPLVGHNDISPLWCFPLMARFSFRALMINTIRIWNVTTNAAIGEPLQGHRGGVYCIAFSPDGTKFASGGDDGTIQLWDSRTFTASGNCFEAFWTYLCLAFSPDSTKIASGSSYNSIQLWDTNSGAAIGKPLIGHTRYHFTCVFT